MIFDLGGVLLSWDPLRLCEAAGANERQTRALMDDFLLHSDWVDMDRGRLDVPSAMDRAVGRGRLDRPLLERVMTEVYDILKPLPESLALLHELREKGFACFVLSNMHHGTSRYLERHMDFLEDFEDVMFSCDTGLAKPDAEIWPLALRRFGLEAADAVFLDDSPMNISAAGKAGIRGVLFTDAAAARVELKAMGLLD